MPAHRRGPLPSGSPDPKHAQSAFTTPAHKTARPRRPLTSPTGTGAGRPHFLYTSPAVPRAARAQTIDTVVSDGLVGAAVFGAERSPDHAERKRAARDALFRDVEPASPGGPFSFYNAASPRRRGRISSFKVPSMAAKDDNAVRSPDSVPVAARPRPPSGAERAHGRRTLSRALSTTFGDTPLAVRVLSFWDREDADRTALVSQVVLELESQLARMAAQGEPYMPLVNATCDSLKLVRDARGVELVLSGRIDTIADPRAVNFCRVAACFRSVKL